MSDTDTPKTAGPYDLGLFLAGSLGRALPFVLVISLFAAGAWYFVKELSLLQDKLNKSREELAFAQVAQAKAEAAAQTAFDKANIQIMGEQAKRLSELNDTSISTSRKIQELVGGQLVNMAQLEARSEVNQRAIIERSQQSLREAQKELEIVKNQVTVLGGTKQQLEAELASGSYALIRDELINLLKGQKLGEVMSLARVFNSRLANRSFLSLAQQDARNESTPLNYRVLAFIEMSRMESTPQASKELSELVKRRPEAATQMLSLLIRPRLEHSTTQFDSVSTKLALQIIATKAIGNRVRLLFMDPYWERYVQTEYERMSMSEKMNLAKALGRILREEAFVRGDCIRPYTYLSWISPEVAHMHVEFLRRDPGEEGYSFCTLMLENTKMSSSSLTQRILLTPEMVRRWILD